MDILRPKTPDFNDLIYRPQVHRKAPHTAPPGEKYCVECKAFRDIDLFASKTGHIYSYCQECRNRKGRKSYTPEKGRKRNYRKYGITQAEYDLMLFQQGGVCAICGQPETLVNGKTGRVQTLSVDHNHKTDQVRELLCNVCNVLVRFIEDDRDRVKKATAYLKKHDR